MINQQLLDYINQQLSQNVSMESIKQALLLQGWQPQDIDEALSQLNAQNSPIPSQPTPQMQPSANTQGGNKKGRKILLIILAVPSSFGVSFVIAVIANVLFNSSTVSGLILLLGGFALFLIALALIWTGKIFSSPVPLKATNSMHGKRQLASRRIAVIHLLISSFVVPMIIIAIWAVVLELVFTILGKNSESKASLIGFLPILYLLLVPLISWIGVMYSARVINKTYFIKDSDEIAKLATIYFLVTSGGYKLFQIIKGSGLTISVIYILLATFVLYIASKRYIHSSDVTNQQDV